MREGEQIVQLREIGAAGVRDFRSSFNLFVTENSFYGVFRRYLTFGIRDVTQDR